MGIDYRWRQRGRNEAGYDSAEPDNVSIAAHLATSDL